MRKCRHRQSSLLLSPQWTREPGGAVERAPSSLGGESWVPGRPLPLTVCDLRGGTFQALFASSGKWPLAVVPKPGREAKPQGKKYSKEIQVHSWRFSFCESGMRPRTPYFCMCRPNGNKRWPAAINAHDIGVTVSCPLQTTLSLPSSKTHEIILSFSHSQGEPKLDYFQAYCMVAYHIHENPQNVEIYSWFIRVTGQVKR